MRENTGDAPDASGLDRHREEWLAAIRDGDLPRLERLLTPEVVWIPPHQPAVSGRDAVLEWLRLQFDEHVYDLRVEPEPPHLAGDWAMERASYTATLRPRSGGPPTEEGGRYLMLWRRGPGETWQVDRYVDLAAAGSA